MTGGRLKRVSNYLENDTFCFTYGDGLSDVNIKKFRQSFEKNSVPDEITNSEIIIDCSDNFETRKCVFDSEILNNSVLKIALKNSVEFELLWLKNKKIFLKEFSYEDQLRIKMLEERVAH